jgi:peptidoglycan hydrolase-like protein with peptidoglycan-binding domain
MNPVTFLMRMRMKGSAVGHLQAALQRLVDRDKIVLDGGAARRKLLAALQREHSKQSYGKATGRTVATFQKAQRLEPNGTVDEATANALNRMLDELSSTGGAQFECLVEGTISLSDGSPGGELKVSVFDRDLRTEQLLGQSITGRDGSYQIQYSAAAFAKAEAGSADLVVKVFDAGGSLLAASPVLFNAPPAAVVNITIPAAVRPRTSIFGGAGNALGSVLNGSTERKADQR